MVQTTNIENSETFTKGLNYELSFARSGKSTPSVYILEILNLDYMEIMLDQIKEKNDLLNPKIFKIAKNENKILMYSIESNPENFKNLESSLKDLFFKIPKDVYKLKSTIYKSNDTVESMLERVL